MNHSLDRLVGYERRCRCRLQVIPGAFLLVPLALAHHSAAAVTNDDCMMRCALHATRAHSIHSIHILCIRIELRRLQQDRDDRGQNDVASA